MSSASSTARWIDCTVDSMLTTTPFFRPREGWLPMPMTSMVASAVISPTSASTLEVPMSRPTMTCLSDFLAIDVRPCARQGAHCRAPGQMSAAALPAHGKAVAVAHVDIGDVRGALAHELRGNRHEALEARIDLQSAEPQFHTVIEPQAQCTT